MGRPTDSDAIFFGITLPLFGMVLFGLVLLLLIAALPTSARASAPQ
jgi:hypothetical protein